MLALAAILACFISVPLLGGRLTRLADVRFRAPGLALAAIAVQVLILEVLNLPHGLDRALHIGTYVLLGAFVWVNRALPGLLVIGLGGLLNAIAITANGGVMPASASALRRAGLADDAGADFINSTAVAHPRLGFLGDVFAIPASWPGANVFSVGDVILLLGAFYALHRICGSRLAGARRRDRPTAVSEA